MNAPQSTPRNVAGELATEHPESLGRAKALALGAAFLGGILAPGLRWALEGSEAQTEAVAKEMRKPAPEPEFGLAPARLSALPAELSAWFDDRFGYRRELIRWAKAAVWFGAGDVADDAMLRFDDDWLFFTGVGAMELHRGELFEPEELAEWVEAFSAWHAWIEARDMQAIFCFAPDKQAVYAERMPDWVGPRAEVTRYDQIRAGLAAEGIELLHLHDDLLEAKDWGLLYYPLGTHWNARGCFVAYERIIHEMGTRLPGLVPHPLELFNEYDKSTMRDESGARIFETWYGDSWIVRQHFPDWVRQECPELLPSFPLPFQIVDTWPSSSGLTDGRVVLPVPQLPKLLLVRDSYGDELWPLLAHQCRELVSEGDRRFPWELIGREYPDVVLTLRVERFLMRPLPTFDLDPEGVRLARAWVAGGPRTELDPGRLGSFAPSPGGSMLRLERADVSTEEAWSLIARGPSGSETREIRFPVDLRFQFVEIPPDTRTVELATGSPVSLVLRALGGDA